MFKFQMIFHLLLFALTKVNLLNHNEDCYQYEFDCDYNLYCKGPMEKMDDESKE